MKNMIYFLVSFFWLFLYCQTEQPEVLKGNYQISKSRLLDKIKGGWAGQTIGCTFGGPTEFRFKGTIIQDYTPIPWDENRIPWQFKHGPGLYDDIYMDLTFVEVFEKLGLDAPADSFAMAFAHADYPLWHANQTARYNILNGIMPPASGHWLNNPHADDIDFQIEADFAGLMCPGMVNTATEICDKIGHIMNYGDGWYGGVYMAAMYALAFVSDDVRFIVKEALKVIPRQSQYYKCISDVIRWYYENPTDWKATWFKIQRKWSEDRGCPDGVFTSFNIDAKINSAWVVLGLLYGEKDFGKTISISTRCGDDSDCNPASAGGILGTVLGYNNIPPYWKRGLSKVEPIDFKYTNISLKDVYAMSFRHALKMIERNGGKVENDLITIQLQQPKEVKFEQGFEGHYPVERYSLKKNFHDECRFEFEGVGFSTTGRVVTTSKFNYILKTELYIDGHLMETSNLPTDFRKRKYTPFFCFKLPEGKHQVYIRILNPTEEVYIQLSDLLVYRSHPPNLRF